MDCRELDLHLCALAVFHSLRGDPVFQRFCALTAAGANPETNARAFAVAAAEFTGALFERGDNWTRYLLDAVLQDENVCIRKAASGGAGAARETALRAELAALQQAGTATLDALMEHLPEPVRAACAFLPRWEVSELDFAAAYDRRRVEVSVKGYGMFARHAVFVVEDGRLVPVKYPDPQRLAELPGYEREREKVIANTRALLAGGPANNVLLYGDAGTGKSSTVKAIANEFAPQGLRLVEVKKNQLYQIPALMDELAQNPLKFILFIDDLSFAANDDNFAALKAILEGSVSGRSKNLAVYATSNRRHLIKETLSDREGDDIHAADTRQELMSLSARFGLTITFQQPDKTRFDAILLELAKQYQLPMPSDQLFLKGEAFALRAGGRSPRVAKQFIELCKAEVQR
jgi:predicted AAA+ superfamily ATPase